MRQTKAMSTEYTVYSMVENRNPKPPQFDPVEFLRKKLKWRYAKGKPKTTGGKRDLGDSVGILS